MFDLQACKFLNVTPPAAIVDNAAFTTTSVDTKGWDAAAFIISLGATDIAFTVMKLRESDDDSSYADITGADFSVAPLTLPSATDDNKLFAIFVNCVGRKRYLDLSLTIGDGTVGGFATVMAILYRGEEMPFDVTTRGLSQQAIV